MRAHARRYTVTESGTRHELPDGELRADRVRELLERESNQTCGFVRVLRQRTEGRDKAATHRVRTLFSGDTASTGEKVSPDGDGNRLCWERAQPTCRACPAQYFARKIFLSTLPTAVSGRVSTNSTCLRACGLPLRSFTRCIIASADGFVPALATISAATAPPHLSSRTPITAPHPTPRSHDHPPP